MSVQHKDIVRGVMVTFDVFSKKDIEKVNVKIKEIFGVEPSIKKSAFFGYPSKTSNIIWKIETLNKVFPVLKNICDEKGWTYNASLMAKYVENFQIWGYDSPFLPLYILMVRISIKKEAMNSSRDLRDDILQVASAARIFIESLEGLRKRTTTFSPSSPLITQLWIKIDKREFSKMRKIELALIDERGELNFDQKQSLSKSLRNLEPVNLSTPVGDIHSHIVFASNVTFALGNMTQVGFGGLMDPFMLYLSYDEKLLQQDLSEHPFGPAELLIGGGITRSEYAHLIGLISMWIYLNHLTSEREKIDREVSKLREAIMQKNFEYAVDQHLSEINDLGTQISSLQQITGRFSRYWEGSLSQIAKGKDTLAIEVSVENGDSLSAFNPSHKGYLATLADHILATLKNNTTFLEKQGLEITSLRTHISDIVSLRISKSNEGLQKTMKTLAEISLAIAIIGLFISVVNWFFLFI